MCGERLKEMRKQKKLTQKKVEELTGIDQSEQSKMERGDRYPTLQQLASLARLYETSMDYLAGMTDEPKPYPAANLKSELKATFNQTKQERILLWKEIEELKEATLKDRQ